MRRCARSIPSASRPTPPFLVTVHECAALPAALADPRIAGRPLMCLGEGSNLLLVGDYPGVMLRQAGSGISILEDAGATVRVRADAGCVWDVLVDWTLAPRSGRAREPGSDPRPRRCRAHPEHRRLRDGDRRVRRCRRSLGSAGGTHRAPRSLASAGSPTATAASSTSSIAGSSRRSSCSFHASEHRDSTTPACARSSARVTASRRRPRSPPPSGASADASSRTPP